MKNELRLVVTQDSKGNPLTIVTNDFKMSAEEISDIYRHRWQIELFFKWLKQHAQIKHLYGKSETAVTNQILIALMTYCVLVLLKLKAGYAGPLLVIQRLLITCRFEPFTSFIRKLYGKQRHPRRRLKHDEIYRLTETQVMTGDTELLYDMTIDPVIL
jgi:IS4 transposase